MGTGPRCRQRVLCTVAMLGSLPHRERLKHAHRQTAMMLTCIGTCRCHLPEPSPDQRATSHGAVPEQSKTSPADISQFHFIKAAAYWSMTCPVNASSSNRLSGSKGGHLKQIRPAKCGGTAHAADASKDGSYTGHISGCVNVLSLRNPMETTLAEYQYVERQGLHPSTDWAWLLVLG